MPALGDSAAHFVLENGLIATKPHGHGDIHTLLYQAGLPESWVNLGKEWMIFI